MFNKIRQLFKGAPAVAAEERRDEAHDDDGILLNAYCTLKQVPAPDFPHRLNNRRGLDDGEMRQHLAGFIGYVIARGDGKMSYAKYHVMRHIERVQQQLSLTVAPADMPAFQDWALRANALVFVPHGDVLSPSGQVLVAAHDGGTEEGAQVPHPADAWDRKARSEQLLQARGIKVPQHLPPLISEGELEARSGKEVAGRALALLICAKRGIEIAGGNDIAFDVLARQVPQAIAFLSPEERAFLETPAPSEHEAVQVAWRYECVALLEWALGLHGELAFPDAICDVVRSESILLAADRNALLYQARLLAPGQILDALDLHYRLHWLVVQARQDGAEPPGGVDGGVVLERHRALNWLVRFENAEWDEVSTPT